MGRIFKNKDGKVIKTEPHTQPHPRPCARDHEGKRLNKPAQAVETTKAETAQAGGDK